MSLDQWLGLLEKLYAWFKKKLPVLKWPGLSDKHPRLGRLASCRALRTFSVKRAVSALLSGLLPLDPSALEWCIEISILWVSDCCCHQSWLSVFGRTTESLNPAYVVWNVVLWVSFYLLTECSKWILLPLMIYLAHVLSVAVGKVVESLPLHRKPVTHRFLDLFVL